MTQPYLIISMGVSGSGKTTLAKRLAEQLNLRFLEADDFHGAESKAHMAAGRPLTDAMREPWIAALCDTVKNEGRSCVLAYSGLRRAHRQRFRELGFKTIFLHLHGERSLIAERLQSRADHFMPSSLLDSQLAALESATTEEDVFPIDLAAPIHEILAEAHSIVCNLAAP